MKYRKKPVVIEAFRVPPADAPPSEKLPWWLLNAILHEPSIVVVADNGSYFINTLEGTMEAQPGDWIIRGVKGELYPCKPDIFEMTYEPVI